MVTACVEVLLRATHSTLRPAWAKGVLLSPEPSALSPGTAEFHEDFVISTARLDLAVRVELWHSYGMKDKMCVGYCAGPMLSTDARPEGACGELVYSRSMVVDSRRLLGLGSKVWTLPP